MPDNFIPLILQNFHQLQRTRYTCDLLDQLCLFVSTYYHLHLSFPHQYPTRETSLKTTKQQPKNYELCTKVWLILTAMRVLPEQPHKHLRGDCRSQAITLSQSEREKQRKFCCSHILKQLTQNSTVLGGSSFRWGWGFLYKIKEFYKLYNFGSKVSILRLSLEKNYVATKILFWWIHMISFIA